MEKTLLVNITKDFFPISCMYLKAPISVNTCDKKSNFS